MRGNLNVPEFCGGCTTIATNLFFTADSIWIEEFIVDVLVKLRLKKNITTKKGTILKFQTDNSI